MSYAEENISLLDSILKRLPKNIVGHLTKTQKAQSLLILSSFCMHDVLVLAASTISIIAALLFVYYFFIYLCVFGLFFTLFLIFVEFIECFIGNNRNN